MAIKRDVQICAKMRPREADDVKALADLRGVTISELVRAALNSMLRQEGGLVEVGVKPDDT